MRPGTSTNDARRIAELERENRELRRLLKNWLGQRAFRKAQAFLFPPDMRDWLPPEHPVWLVITVVEDHLDTSVSHAARTTGGGGHGSRRARSAAVSPPSGYLMLPAYRTTRQPPPGRNPRH